jgi:hypothetical protein
MNQSVNGQTQPLSTADLSDQSRYHHISTEKLMTSRRSSAHC